LNRFLMIAVMVVGLAAAGAAAQQVQETVRDTYGAWDIRCVEGVGCVMSQAGKGTEGNNVIEVRIRKLAGAKAQDGANIPAAIQVATPLGVLLSAGVRIQIGSGEVRTAPYELCGPAGCVVRQPMSDKFLTELKKGSNAKVTIVAAPDRKIELAISLKGFTKAFKNLEP